MARTLLLADDSVTIQKVVGISFANEDVEILTVDNGDDAILRTREARPDVVLADVVMPGKNGYEVCDAIKKDPSLGHIPVLLLTGTFEAFDEERAAQARADGHITKPFEAQALVDRVNILLAGTATAPAPAAEPASPPTAESAVAAPAAPTPAPEPAPEASAADDEGFDFFDDVLETENGPPSENAATAFEIDAGESAFDFAPVVADAAQTGPPSESPTIVTPPPMPEPGAGGMPDATVALGVPLADSEESWGDDELDAAFGVSTPPPSPPDAEDPSARTTVFEMDSAVPTPTEDPVASPAAEPSDDFSFEADAADDFLGDLDGSEADRQAVSNPDLGRDFAVSSSDLGSPLAEGPGSEAGAFGALEPPEEPLRDTGPLPRVEPDLPEPEPDFPATPEPIFHEVPAFDAPADEPTVSPNETAFGQDVGPVFEATPEPEEPPFHAAAELTEVPVEGPGEPTFDSPDDVFVPLAEAAAEDFAPAPEQPEAASGAGPDLTPMMRERIHETIEKIAWEAFADLPDRIVREALAKIEQIAWETIPQMAETMIREEIRRMKGESE